MTPQHPRQIVTALRLVFWGGLVMLLDLNINRFDLLNDAVGAVIVFKGVHLLADLPVDDRYRRVMQFVRVTAMVSVFSALVQMMPAEPAKFLSVGFLLFGVVAMAAIVAFCVAMRWLAEAGMLTESARSWRLTARLFTFIYLIPLGLFFLGAAVAVVMGKSFHADAGGLVFPLVCLLVPLMLAPPIHLFVSTSRMIREADRRAASGEEVPLPTVPEPRTRPFQFTLRTLLIVTAAVAVLGGFLARPTIFYWQLSVVGLVTLGVVVFLFGLRKLSWGIWGAAAVLILFGGTSVRMSSSSSGTASIHTRQECEIAMAALEDWLLQEGFTPDDSPAPPHVFVQPQFHRPTGLETRQYVLRPGPATEVRVIASIEPLTPPEDDRCSLSIDFRTKYKGFRWNHKGHEEEVQRIHNGVKRATEVP